MKLTNDIVKTRLKKVFGDKYDLSLVDYKGKNENITLICKKHGQFSARLSAFTNRKQECPSCKKQAQLDKITDYLQGELPHIHLKSGQKYKNNKTRLNFRCDYHGDFKNTWNSVSRGKHCQKCGEQRHTRRAIPIETVLQTIKDKHNDTIKVLNPENYENLNSKLSYKCSEGHTWSVPIKGLYRGNGCKKCAGLDISTDDFKISLQKVHQGNISLVSGQKYKGRKEKLLFECLDKSHPPFSAAPSNIIFNKSGCPECKKEKLKDFFSYTTEQVYEILEKKYGGNFKPLTGQIYENQKTKWWFSCVEETHPKWQAGVGGYLNTEIKHGCRLCYGERPHSSIPELELRLKEKFGEKLQLVSVDEENITLQTQITVRCEIHKSQHTEKVRNILNSYGCLTCSIENRQENRRTNIADLKDQIFEVHREFISLTNPEDYINTETKLTFKCYKDKHGYFEATTHSIISGSGCPICKMSHGERKILFWLRDNRINHEWQYRVKKHRNKGHFIFDFFLPELNYLIEYDGRQHFVAVEAWGGSEALAKTKENDQLKNEYAEINRHKMLRISFKQDNQIDEILTKSLIEGLSDYD